VTVRATDSHGNASSRTFDVTVLGFTRTGFFQPVNNPGVGAAPVFNVAKAGNAIPVKLSLGGDMGLEIFAGGYPKVVATVESSAAPEDPIELTVQVVGSGLQYDPATKQYTCVWKTTKGVFGPMQLQVLLKDGAMHVA
jgi:hypothetical protein